jgi:hypothetical protein
VPPALPGYAVSAAAKLQYTSRDYDGFNTLGLPSPAPPTTGDSFSRMLTRAAATPVNGYSANPPVMAANSSLSLAPGSQSESGIVHQHIQETANKRISTLDYLRKACVT